MIDKRKLLANSGEPMKTKLFVLFVAVWAPLALGHHSTSMFNMGAPATMEGTVKSFDWMNPHSLLHLEVPNSEGKPEEWVVEIHSIAIMVRRGYTKDYFKPGDKITVVGGQMKDGSHMMRLLRGTKADGTKFYGDDFSPSATGATSAK
jgi:hypothetical protein